MSTEMELSEIMSGLATVKVQESELLVKAANGDISKVSGESIPERSNGTDNADYLDASFGLATVAHVDASKGIVYMGVEAYLYVRGRKLNLFEYESLKKDGQVAFSLVDPDRPDLCKSAYRVIVLDLDTMTFRVRGQDKWNNFMPDGVVHAVVVGVVHCAYASTGAYQADSLDYVNFKFEHDFESGRTVFDFNPASVVVPKLENLVHQKRNSSFVLQSKQVVLLHLTDIHGDDTNLRRILEFKDRYSKYIDLALHTGDAIYDKFDTDTMDFWTAAGAQSVLNVIGNHDTTSTATEAQVYSKIFAPYIANWGVTYTPNKCYYYKDITKGNGTEQAKIRIIVLDEYHWDSVQIAWFTSTLTSARTNGFAVIAARHAGFNANQFERCPFTSLEHFGSKDSLKEAQDAVDAFKQNGGTFIMWLGGHTHQDVTGTLPNYPDQLVFLSNQSGRNHTGWSDSWRKTGTKSQDLFTLVGIDLFEKVVRFVRIGADRDRYDRLRDTMAIKFDTCTML